MPSRLALLALSLVCLLPSAKVQAEVTWIIQRLTSSAYLEFSADVSGRTVTWSRRFSDNDDRIMKWTEGDSEPAVVAPGYSPSIHNGRIVWVASDGHDLEVFQWSDGVVSQLTSTSYNEFQPTLWEDATAWVSAEPNSPLAIILDTDEGPIRILAGGDRNNQYPALSRNRLVWEARGNAYSDVFAWRDGVVVQMTSNAFSVYRPRTDGRSIIWYTDTEIPLHEQGIWKSRFTGGLHRVSPAGYQPDLDGDSAVFCASDGHDLEIFLTYLGRQYQLTENDFDDLEPRVDGDRVVWVARPDDHSSPRDIYYAMLSGLEGGETAGACCLSELDCVIATSAECQALGGRFRGRETACDSDACGVGPARTWSTEKHDSQRSGHTSVELPCEWQRMWSAPVGSAEHAPVVAPDGTIHVNAGGYIQALRPDGTTRWQVRREAIGGSAVRNDGVIYVPTRFGSSRAVWKLAAEDGRLLCEGQDSSSRSALLDRDGDLFFTIYGYGGLASMASSCFGRFRVINERIDGELALGLDGHLYANIDAYLTKFHSDDGSVLWSLNTQYVASAPSVGPDGAVYATVDPRTVICVNPDGSQRWLTALSDQNLYVSRHSPTIARDGRVYVAAWRYNPEGSVLVALDQSGAPRWEGFKPGSRDVLPVVSAGRDIVILSSLFSDRLLGLSAETGDPLWQIQLSAAAKQAPVITETAMLLAMTENGDLEAWGSPQKTCTNQEGLTFDRCASRNGRVFATARVYGGTPGDSVLITVTPGGRKRYCLDENGEAIAKVRVNASDGVFRAEWSCGASKEAPFACR